MDKSIKLREYQQRVLDAVKRSVVGGKKRILVVLPTGAGKTHVMASIAQGCINKDNRVLALMHRRGLVDQMIERFDECGIKSGCIMAGIDTDLQRQCQVASLWTFSRRVAIASHFRVDAQVLLIDEAHHTLNNTYKKVLPKYSDSLVIGFTATPTLSSGVGLGEYFDDLINVVPMQELLDKEYLVPGAYYGPSEPDLSSVPIKLGDYTKKGLDKKLNTPKIIGDVVQSYLQYGQDKTAMCFAINRKHALALSIEFNRNGVAAEYLDAHNSDEERQEVIDRLKAGDTRVVCQVALYTEGTDIPELECIIIARPTRSLGLHRQIIGRGARPNKGKYSFTVIDHGGNVLRLGYYEDEIDWKLNNKKCSNNNVSRKINKEKVIHTCDFCKSLITGKICATCGNEIKSYGRKVEVLESELIEYGVPTKTKKIKRIPYSEKIDWFGMFEYHRRERGYKKGWTAHKFKEKFGKWPTGIVSPPKPPTQEFKNWLKYLQIKRSKAAVKNKKESAKP